MTGITEYISRYVKWMRVNNYSENTIKNTRYYLKDFNIFLSGNNMIRIEDIRYESIRDYQEDLAFRISRYGRLWEIKSQNSAISRV